MPPIARSITVYSNAAGGSLASGTELQAGDALKRTLLGADSNIHNNLDSGLLFAKQRIGIAEQLKSKIVVINGNTELVGLANRKGNDVAAGNPPNSLQARTFNSSAHCRMQQKALSCS